MRKKLLVSRKAPGVLYIVCYCDKKALRISSRYFFPTGSSSLPLRTTQLSVRQVTFFILMIIVLWHC